MWGWGREVRKQRKRQRMQRERVFENLHNALYGHESIAIETSQESFRTCCRLHAKWKEYLERLHVWRPCRRPLFSHWDINGYSKSPLRIKVVHTCIQLLPTHLIDIPWNALIHTLWSPHEKGTIHDITDHPAMTLNWNKKKIWCCTNALILCSLYLSLSAMWDRLSTSLAALWVVWCHTGCLGNFQGISTV